MNYAQTKERATKKIQKLQRTKREKREESRCEESRLSLVWFFDIYGLQFGIVGEVLLPLGFGFAIW